MSELSPAEKALAKYMRRKSIDGDNRGWIDDAHNAGFSAGEKNGQREMLEKVRSAIKKIAEKYPLEGDHEGDARHNYPDRSRALRDELDKLEAELKDG
ncbi:hypothetical protein LCGC14_1730900 [marine sediment metagenome]|uniref:Uncharacterized protein n=1 Tax=marine sediment metagenome TaxID=412755 RepID=A0A0F9HXB7_9ZZZZ